jgi:hypothetical protein
MELNNIDNGTYAGTENNGTFTGNTATTCAANGQLPVFGDSINSQGGTLTCAGAATTYVAHSPLVSTGAGVFCVDSTGFSGEIAAAPTGATCNA